MDLNKETSNKIPKTNKINYKNVAIAIITLIFIVLIPYLLKSSKKTEEKLKKETNSIQKQNGFFDSLTEKKEEQINKIPPVISESKIREEQEENEAIKEAIRRAERGDEIDKDELSRREAMMELELQRRHAGLVLKMVNNSKNQQQTQSGAIQNGITIPPFPGELEPDDNFQKKKTDFIKNSSEDVFVLNKPLAPPVSEYEVKAGSIIPLTLETGINSDLPGLVTAVVKEDVYDSKTGKILLIPGGSRVLGKFNSNISFGQERVQIVFNRLTLPNQKSINLGTMYGTDQMGQSGATDKVNNHMTKVWTSVLMSAILGGGTAAITHEDERYDSNGNEKISYGDEAGKAAGAQMLSVGAKYTDRLLNVQPTLEIRPGYTVGLMVGKDLLLEPYRKK